MSKLVVFCSTVLTMSLITFIQYKKKSKLLCKYCNKNCNRFGIDVKYCPRFKPLKHGCSKSDYIAESDKIVDKDILGFCAAGFFIYHDDNILVALETREGKELFNFIGGKRESKSETPYQTASRELQEEIKGDIKDYEKGKKALWIAQSKYFLFPVEAKSSSISENTLIKTQWIKIKDIIEMINENKLHEKFHTFACNMIQSIDQKIGFINFK